MSSWMHAHSIMTPPENIVPSWLLPCTCGQQSCHCNDIFKLDLLCVKGLSYQSPPPTKPDDNLTIQFIQFTHYNDRILDETIIWNIEKYKLLVDNVILNKGWKVDPLIIITTSARATTHIPSMENIETTFKIPKLSIKYTFVAINIIAIQHVVSIILHKRRIENNKPLPINTQLP